MKPSLRPGLSATFRYPVGGNRTVPHIFPDAPEFQLMPAVLATGYLVALCEWAAIALVKPHLDWPREQSLGTRVDMSHLAATPPGHTVSVTVTLIAVEGRKLTFATRAHDGKDLISEGTHERHVIDAPRFNEKLFAKAASRERAAA
jgi:fluoroacetyl-CoA thioesterase